MGESCLHGDRKMMVNTKRNATIATIAHMLQHTS